MLEKLRESGGNSPAALVAAFKSTERDQSGGTSFIKGYAFDLTAGEHRPTTAHLFETCPTLASQRPRLEIGTPGTGVSSASPRLAFTAAPGPGRLIAFGLAGGRTQLITNRVNLESPQSDATALPQVGAAWRSEPGLLTAAERWLMAGGPSRAVLTTTVGKSMIEHLARILRINLV